MKITIVDYGMGNIYSLQSALKFLGCDSICSNKSEDIINADKIILPGVGSFKQAIYNIRKLKIDKSLEVAIKEKKTPILGICLGMQLLGISSTEDDFSIGLNLFQGYVDKFTDQSIKIPHVGFNNVSYPEESVLYKGINENSDFYFVHSYKMHSNEINGVAYCSHGENFVASFEKGNVFGTQFHPEKSQTNGLSLLKNFIEC
jgi:imidazole glycerol-phosphate synthase subunit HisH